MSTPVVTTEIGEVNYSYSRLPVKEAMKLHCDLMQVLKGPIGALVLQVGDASSSSLAEAALHAVQSLITELPYEKLTSLMDPIMGRISIEGIGKLSKSPDYLNGKLMLAYKLWLWGLREEFRDFLDESLYMPLLAQMKALTDPSITAPTEA